MDNNTFVFLLFGLYLIWHIADLTFGYLKVRRGNLG